MARRAGPFGGWLSWGASSVTWFMYQPMLVLELTLARWFIVKGLGLPARRQLV